MGIPEIIGSKRARLLELSAAYGASNLRVFGSIARGEAIPDSDVDPLVDGLEKVRWGGGHLLIDIQTLLQRQVDLVSENDIHPTLPDAILREAIRL